MAVVPTTRAGRPKVSDETRARLRAISKAKYDALTPEQQAAQKAHLIHGPRKMPGIQAGAPGPPGPSGGTRNPLDDAPRAYGGGNQADPLEGRRLGGPPPRFEVPDLPPLELGSDGAGLEDLGQPTPDELAGFTVDPDQVADMLSLPFDFLADRRGDHWRLRPLERERLSGAIARKVNQHAAVARALDAGGDWILIVGGLAMILSTRLAEDARHAATADPAAGARPGLAGLRVLAARRGAPPPAAGARPGPVQLDGAGAGSGSLNGARTDDGAGAPAVDAEAPRRTLEQTF